METCVFAPSKKESKNGKHTQETYRWEAHKTGESNHNYMVFSDAAVEVLNTCYLMAYNTKLV